MKRQPLALLAMLINRKTWKHFSTIVVNVNSGYQKAQFGDAWCIMGLGR
jgi:hypothetical protein